MELRYLHYFLITAKYENMTQAADILHITQPNLSKIISTLEKEFNAKLFDRRGRSIKLNENGKIVKEHCEKIMRELDDIDTELANRKTDSSSEILISFNSASMLMPSLTTSFQNKYPNIHLHFANETSITYSCSCNFDSYLTKPSSNSILLLNEPCCIVMSQNHRLADKVINNDLCIKDLKNEIFLYTNNCHSIYDLTYKLAMSGGFKPIDMIKCISNDTVFSFLRQNIGVAIIPMITWNLKEQKDLLSYTFSDFPMMRYLYMTHSTTASSNSTEAFCHYCENFFEEIQNNAAKTTGFSHKD